MALFVDDLFCENKKSGPFRNVSLDVFYRY